MMTTLSVVPEYVQGAPSYMYTDTTVPLWLYTNTTAPSYTDSFPNYEESTQYTSKHWVCMWSLK